MLHRAKSSRRSTSRWSFVNATFEVFRNRQMARHCWRHWESSWFSRAESWGSSIVNDLRLITNSFSPRQMKYFIILSSVMSSRASSGRDSGSVCQSDPFSRARIGMTSNDVNWLPSSWSKLTISVPGSLLSNYRMRLEMLIFSAYYAYYYYQYASEKFESWRQKEAHETSRETPHRTTRNLERLVLFMIEWYACRAYEASDRVRTWCFVELSRITITFPHHQYFADHWAIPLRSSSFYGSMRKKIRIANMSCIPPKWDKTELDYHVTTPTDRLHHVGNLFWSRVTLLYRIEITGSSNQVSWYSIKLFQMVIWRRFDGRQWKTSQTSCLPREPKTVVQKNRAQNEAVMK